MGRLHGSSQLRPRHRAVGITGSEEGWGISQEAQNRTRGRFALDALLAVGLRAQGRSPGMVGGLPVVPSEVEIQPDCMLRVSLNYPHFKTILKKIYFSINCH